MISAGDERPYTDVEWSTEPLPRTADDATQLLTQAVDVSYGGGSERLGAQLQTWDAGWQRCVLRVVEQVQE